MQVTVDKISDLERKITVQVPAEQVDGRIEERLKSMAPRTKVHGFRPGKVPLRVVRQMYGKQVREEVIGELIQNSFPGSSAPPTSPVPSSSTWPPSRSTRNSASRRSSSSR